MCNGSWPTAALRHACSLLFPARLSDLDHLLSPWRSCPCCWREGMWRTAWACGNWDWWSNGCWHFPRCHEEGFLTTKKETVKMAGSLNMCGKEGSEAKRTNVWTDSRSQAGRISSCPACSAKPVEAAGACPSTYLLEKPESIYQQLLSALGLVQAGKALLWSSFHYNFLLCV